MAFMYTLTTQCAKCKSFTVIISRLNGPPWGHVNYDGFFSLKNVEKIWGAMNQSVGGVSISLIQKNLTNLRNTVQYKSHLS